MPISTSTSASTSTSTIMLHWNKNGLLLHGE
jgi:hypothetical protein